MPCYRILSLWTDKGRNDLYRIAVHHLGKGHNFFPWAPSGCLSLQFISFSYPAVMSDVSSLPIKTTGALSVALGRVLWPRLAGQRAVWPSVSTSLTGGSSGLFPKLQYEGFGLEGD